MFFRDALSKRRGEKREKIFPMEEKDSGESRSLPWVAVGAVGALAALGTAVYFFTRETKKADSEEEAEIFTIFDVASEFGFGDCAWEVVILTVLVTPLSRGVGASSL